MLTSTGGRAGGTPAERKRRGGNCEDRTRREEVL